MNLLSAYDPASAPKQAKPRPTHRRSREIQERRSKLLEICRPFEQLLDTDSPERLDELFDALLEEEKVPRIVETILAMHPWEFPELGNPWELIRGGARWDEFICFHQESLAILNTLSTTPWLKDKYTKYIPNSPAAARANRAPPPEIMELVFREQRPTPAMLVLFTATWRKHSLPTWMRDKILAVFIDGLRAELLLWASVGALVDPKLLEPERPLDLPALYKEIEETYERWTEEAKEFARQRASLARWRTPSRRGTWSTSSQAGSRTVRASFSR